MFRSLATIASKRPYLIATLALLIVAGAFLYGGRVSNELNTWGFDDPGSEYFRALDKHHDAGGYDPTGEVLALVETRGPVSGPRGRALAAKAEAIFRDEPAIERVRGPFDHHAAPALISRDGKAALVAGYLKPEEINGPASDRLLHEFKDLRDEGLTLGSGAITRKVVSNTVEEDLRVAEMIAFPLLFLFALIVFRGLIAATIPVLIGLIAIPFSFSVMRFIDQFSELSVFSLNLVTGLGLGLAIDYSLLMVTRFREELAIGLEPTEAVRRTVESAGRTVFFSSLTVAGAAASLLIFPQTYLYSMGVGGITVALTSALVALVVLPPFLTLVGRRIDSLSIARRSADDSHKSWLALGTWVMRRPLRVALITSILIIAMAAPMLGIRFTSMDASVLPAGYAARHVEQTVENRFQSSPLTATIFALASAKQSQRNDVLAYAQRVNNDRPVDYVGHVGPPAYLGKDTWRVDVFPTGGKFSRSAQEAVKHARAVSGDLPVQVSGNSAWFVDQKQSITDNIPLLLSIICAITFVVLFLMTGSVVLPLKTFFLNLATLAATFGLLVWVFQEGRLEQILGYQSQGALEITQPVILFAIAFGLATDYGVFLLSRIKELHDAGHDNNRAVTLGLAYTGRIVTAAALLFCIAMITFATSRIAFIKGTGIGTALAVAIDATLIRALLVPSLMGLLGDYNWWAPKPLRRLYERIGWKESAHAPPGSEPVAPAGSEVVISSGGGHGGAGDAAVAGLDDGRLPLLTRTENVD